MDLAGAARQLTEDRRAWLRHRLFDGVRYCDDDPAARQRYRDAARWAARLLGGLGALAASDRIATLRRFHAAGVPAKLRFIESLA